MKDLLTTRDLETRHLMSKVTQWQERKAGRLGYIKIGRKVLYREEHIDEYLKQRECAVVNSTENRNAKNISE